MKINKLKYYDLTRELAITGFKMKYQGSFFGYLWSLMKPLFLFLILYIVFNNVFKLGSTIPYYAVYLLLGITLFQFFVETTSMCMGSIVGNGDLIRKVYFPRIIMPIAISLTSFATLILNLVVVAGFAMFSKVPFTFNIFILPLYLVEFYIFTISVSLFLAAIFVKFRDIGPIWEVIAQGLFYATPILYPTSLVPTRFLKILMLSPLAQVIQGARSTIISGNITTSWSVLGWYSVIPFILVITILGISYMVFQKMAAKFAEEV